MTEARWLVWIVIGLAGLAGTARAESAWTGTWLVEGTTERVYVDEAQVGLAHARTLPSPDGSSVWDFELRGAPRGARAELEGTVRIGVGRQPARLVATRAGGALEVSLTAGTEVVRRERWVRPRPATVAVRVVGGAVVTPEGALLRGAQEAAPLELELVVGGRPQALLLTIACIDTGVYPEHDDVVVWQPLRQRSVDPADDVIGRPEAQVVDVGADERYVDAEQVPAGVHPMRWDGRDRIDREPLRPGSYRLVVSSLDAPIGPAVREADCAPVVLTLHVLPAELTDEPAGEVAEATPVAVEVKRPRTGGFVRSAGR